MTQFSKESLIGDSFGGQKVLKSNPVAIKICNFAKRLELNIMLKKMMKIYQFCDMNLKTTIFTSIQNLHEFHPI